MGGVAVLISRSCRILMFSRIPGSKRSEAARLVGLATELVARIDLIVSEQIDQVLHHPDFQTLERAWIGLRWMAWESASWSGHVQVRCLSADWRDLARDVRRNGDVLEGTRLFTLIHERAYGTAGGIPFGVVLGDFEVGPGDSSGQGISDIDVLDSVVKTCASAFTCFICGAAPKLLGLDDFRGLERQPDLERMSDRSDVRRWRARREQSEYRFLGMVAPRVLCRLPRRDRSICVELTRCGRCAALIRDQRRGECPSCPANGGSRPVRTERLGFRYSERVGRASRPGYLWGTAVFAFGSVLARSFGETSWFADIRGYPRLGNSDGTARGGTVDGLPQDEFGLDRHGVATKPVTDVIIDDPQERALAELGLVSLCSSASMAHAAFLSAPSAWAWDRAHPELASRRIGAMLQYTLCVSRIAHHVRVMARDLLGSGISSGDLQKRLNGWINRYVADASVDASQRARFPLRAGSVKVEDRGSGVFECEITVNPHFQFDAMDVSVRLQSRIAAAS